MKSIKSVLVLLVLFPFGVAAQRGDTAAIFNHFVKEYAENKAIGYSYTMNIKFPNGNKDTLTGDAYLNTGDKLYYNQCNAFTMVYSPRWFYKANHRNKTIAILDLDKEKDKKLRKKREDNVFRNDMLNTFIDSVLLKKGIFKQFAYDGSTCKVLISFPKTETVKTFEMAFDTLLNMPVSYKLSMLAPMQKTSKGVLSAEITISCRDFRQITDKSPYLDDAFFSCKKNKFELKKYNSYKLTSKI